MISTRTIVRAVQSLLSLFKRHETSYSSITFSQLFEELFLLNEKTIDEMHSELLSCIDFDFLERGITPFSLETSSTSKSSEKVYKFHCLNRPPK
jgi:hypothetical protein